MLSNSQCALNVAPQPQGGLLTFDFPALRIGSATYAEGPTGCTVFHFPKQARFAVDVRGGAPGVLLLGQWESGEQLLDAVCFTGGSVYGFEALTGVSAEIFSERNHSGQWFDIARVHGAVIYDYRPRNNTIYPDRALGQAAYRAAVSGVFPCGRVGAGASATAGKLFGAQEWEYAGQGGAFFTSGDLKVAVFTVVNAVGVVTDRSGKVVCGLKSEQSELRSTPIERVHQTLNSDANLGNTTLTILVTNQRLTPFALRQLARQVHTSMARAIHPFHAPTDGDVFFAVSTEELDSTQVSEVELGIIASELAWDAVLSSCLKWN